jgi:beta-lactamase class A
VTALGVLIVLAGCGAPSSGSSAPTSAPSATFEPVAAAEASASLVAPTGTPMAVGRPQTPATPFSPIHAATPLAPPDSPAAPPAPVVRANPVTEVPDTPEQRAATELIADETGVYGYVVLEADGTVVASINGTTPFITASTYKLILMADILWRVESGMYDLDDTLPLTYEALGDWGDNRFTEDDLGSEFTIEEYLYAVGVWSSNAAAHVLLTLTTPEMLRMTAKVIGMEDTYLLADPAELPLWPPELGPDASREEWEVAIEYLEASAEEAGAVNISTPLDMARYQLAVINDTLISPWVSQQVGDILAQQALRDGFPHFLDGQYSSFSKPGNLPDAANDVGGIFLPDGPRAVAIMSLAVPDIWWTTLIQQRLALIATGETDVPSLPW